MPNFPDHQKTGALAEQDVMRLFTEWSWNAGKDQIDSGYDLCVGPDHAKYKGARFMVQVKGTAMAKVKASVTAPVAKERLRQYAESVMPVFIVRVTSDGGIYWIHAQEWASQHRSRLSGSGAAGVRIDKANDLRDRERFEAYLETAFAKSPTLGKPVSDLEREVSILNSLDPKLGVKIRHTENGKEHEFYSKDEAFEGKVTFSPVQTEENISKLRDAIQYGLPRKVEVDQFQMTGSPVFERVSEGFGKGTVTIGRGGIDTGCARLYPGSKYSITASPLELDFRAYKGQAGVALSNEEIESSFNLMMKLGLNGSRGKANVDLGLRNMRITGFPIKDLDELRPLVDWAEQVIVRKALFVELALPRFRERLTMSTGDESVDSLLPMLRWMSVIGRLHLVAKALNSDFSLSEPGGLSEEDLSDIGLSYALLKGDRRKVFTNEITVDNVLTPIEQVTGHRLNCATTLEIEVQGRKLGHIPVVMDLVGFNIDSVPGTKSLRILPTEHSEAWISFDADAK